MVRARPEPADAVMVLAVTWRDASQMAKAVSLMGRFMKKQMCLYIFWEMLTSTGPGLSPCPHHGATLSVHLYSVGGTEAPARLIHHHRKASHYSLHGSHDSSCAKTLWQESGMKMQHLEKCSGMRFCII